MRKFVYILILGFLFGAKESRAGGNRPESPGYLAYASYNTASGRSYLETYIAVIGNNTKFVKGSSGTYQAKVNISIAFLRKDSTIANANNYNLNSPGIKDTLKKPDFVDVQRYWLPKGEYALQVSIKDMNDPKGLTFTKTENIAVGYSKDSIKIADVEFLQSYTPSANRDMLSKNGYEIVPAVFNRFPGGVKELKFYTEVYNANKLGGVGDKFILKYYIENADTKAKMKDYTSMSVQQADTINPLIGGFNIESLASGNYNLVVQVIDKSNNVKVSRSFGFMRHNPHVEATIQNLATIDINNTFVARYNNRDSLLDYISGLTPIANIGERDFIESDNFKKTDITLLKQFFYNFWSGRNKIDPEGEWKKYEERLIAVNKTYSTPTLKGWQTDRGRIYLKHGPPNHLVKETLNPAYYPYEIWEYYKLEDGEVDRKFVFYLPNSATNDYILLHSTANNEVHERRWELMLNQRNGLPYNIDVNNTGDDPIGEDALDMFNNPR